MPLDDVNSPLRGGRLVGSASAHVACHCNPDQGFAGVQGPGSNEIGGGEPPRELTFSRTVCAKQGTVFGLLARSRKHDICPTSHSRSPHVPSPSFHSPSTLPIISLLIKSTSATSATSFFTASLLQHISTPHFPSSIPHLSSSV